MNEATRRIAEQAFSFAYVECKKMGRKGGEGDHIWVSLAMGKQHELIVNECVSKIESLELSIGPFVMSTVKEHFGVE